MVTRWRAALGALAAVWAWGASTAHAQVAGGRCTGSAAGCTEAEISFRHREGLPVEVDIDTDWQPRNSPVQVRFRLALVGHTEMRQQGWLVGQWPEPVQLSVAGAPMGGSLETDWGLQLLARIRLNLDVEGRNYAWEGNVPYVPQVDFRATGRTVFDPWAFNEVSARGVTMRQRIADVPITDAFVRIPGVSGGFSFDAGAEIEAGWRSVRFDFGLLADPITASTMQVQGRFSAGPFVEYSPVLEGVLSYRGTLRVYPSMYVSLLGRRWALDLPNLPIAVGPFPRQVRTMPSLAHLALPDLQTDGAVLDFGDVDVGAHREETVTLRNDGELTGAVLNLQTEGPFRAETSVRSLPTRARGLVLVTFAPVAPGPSESTLVIETNDPDTPRLRVTVRGNGVGAMRPDTPDAAAVDAGVAADGGEGLYAVGDGGCGCRSAPSRAPVAPVWALASVALMARRRRRKN